MWYALAMAASLKCKARRKARRSRANKWIVCWSWERRASRSWYCSSERPSTGRRRDPQRNHALAGRKFACGKMWGIAKLGEIRMENATVIKDRFTSADLEQMPNGVDRYE